MAEADQGSRILVRFWIIKKLDQILEMADLDHKPPIEAEFLESQLRGMIEMAQDDTKSEGGSSQIQCYTADFFGDNY